MAYNFEPGIILYNPKFVRVVRAKREVQERVEFKRQAEAEKLARVVLRRQKCDAIVERIRVKLPPGYVPPAERVLYRVCAVFGITRAELTSNRRHKRTCFARQMAYYWIARLTNLSLPQIGGKLGGKDHTSVMAGRKAYVIKRAKMGRYLRPLWVS